MSLATQSCLFATSWIVVSQISLSMGILQVRILEWFAMPSSRGSSQPRYQAQVSHNAGDSLCLSHQGSPKILKWVTRGSSQPKNWARISCIAVRFFTSWATRETLNWSIRLYWCLLKRQLISYFSTPFSKGSRCSSRIHVDKERMMCVAWYS